MNVMVNDTPYTLPKEITVVKELLAHLDLSDRIVMVQVNEAIIDHDQHDSREIRDGDAIQLVQFVGGG